ncbi:hypothetical protein AN958_11680 [Leucoagaricus sp. SymC.cos]|nr:hypothetical protein AN958_11680 [Leucoagaricus sp. SymC.cos]
MANWTGVERSVYAPSKMTKNCYAALNIEMDEDLVKELIDSASCQRVINNKITMKKGLTYTAPLKEDFPTPQITKPYSTRIAVNILNTADHTEGHQARQAIRSVVSCFLEREENNQVKILQPSTEDGKSGEKDGNPWYFVILGLTKTEHDLAIKTKVIASQEATLFILLQKQPIPNFIMMLKDLSFNDNKIDEARKSIIEIVKEKLDSELSINQTLASLLEDCSTTAKEQKRFIDHICIFLITIPHIKPGSKTTEHKHYWCVFSGCMPPFNDIHAYNTFIESLNHLVFGMPSYGTGSILNLQDNFTCKLCKSRDHPTAACPFPSIPGWIAPNDDTFSWHVAKELSKGGKRKNSNPKAGLYSRNGKKQPPLGLTN